MTRTQTLFVTTALALAFPLTAMAQSPSASCGTESWSTEHMAYKSRPCGAGEVSTAGPTARGANNSSSMTKAEQKQQPYAGYATAPMPRQQAQAVMSNSSYSPMNASMGASMGPSCGPSNMPSITDEYGRKYNCRGDRIR
jgi:hypothetical protein